MKHLHLAGALILAATPVVSQDIDQGEKLFNRYCATCHGLDADGTGPMSGVLTIPPADLTRLTARNDATFPAARVAARIDGRDPLVSHGSPMPVYGDFFEGEDIAIKLQTGQPMMTSRPIADLLTFLENLQVE